MVVGSAKLGFSIAPDKRYREFCDDSDIDVAIVSGRLFDVVMKEVYLYGSAVTYWPERKAFDKYMAQGWMRPDKLPRGEAFVFSREWDDFFRHLSQSKMYGEYPIKAGLYKDWIYLEKYQEKSVAGCMQYKGI